MLLIDAKSSGYCNVEVYSDLDLYVAPYTFYIRSKNEKLVLVIDRVNESQNLVPYQDDLIPMVSSCRTITGVLGAIRLINGKYLIVARDRILVGQLAGHKIWRLSSFEIIPFNRQQLHLTAKQIELNERYLAMVDKALRTQYFYFSYTFDLSHSLQRIYSNWPAVSKQNIFERSETRFVWNKFLLKNILDHNTKRFCLPLIHGYISINQCNINNKLFDLILISRRSIERAGCRYFRRGIDENGHVANFVETEQIIACGTRICSFVQTRGSIPLFWSQLPNLKYKPRPRLRPASDSQNLEACSKHLQAQIAFYGKQTLVNLIDQRGREQFLEAAYGSTVAALDLERVRYVPFDFHSECKNMRWDRLTLLLDKLRNDLDEMGYFSSSKDGSGVQSLQTGVFRTNCIDCLDRTNVVQSILARENLTNVLVDLDIMRPTQQVKDFDDLEKLFKEIWANNADMLSVQYAGTGALKTDFTRTGKRTRSGMFQDGFKSMSRYFINNFANGFTQDSVDLLLGNYVIEENEGLFLASPLEDSLTWRKYIIPSILAMTLSMFAANIIFTRESSTEYYLSMLFWGSMLLSTGYYLLLHGNEYVDQPKLLDF